MNDIKSKIKDLSNSMTIEKIPCTDFYYINARNKKQLDLLNPDDYISLTELKKYITRDINYLLNYNTKLYFKNMYPEYLREKIKKINIKKLSNKNFVLKKDVEKFIEFERFYNNLSLIRTKNAEVRKLMKKYYGNPSEVTQICIDANFNCAECRNLKTCKQLKTTISQKQVAQLMHLLGYGNSQNLNSAIMKINCLEEVIRKYEKINTKLLNSKYPKNTYKKYERELNNLNKENKKLMNEILSIKKNILDIRKTIYKNIPHFTAKELEIIDYVIKGYKLKDIAILFEISIPRVRQYKEYFFRKLRKLNKILQEVE